MKRALIAVALAASPAWGAPAGAGVPHVFAVTTDYETSGNCAAIDIGAPHAVSAGLEPIGSDPVVRWHQPYLYVLNRSLSDDIQVIDPADGAYVTRSEVSVGPGSNPQDIVVIDSTRAYLSRYESAWLYEVNPQTGEVLDSVDLTPFADGDGLPEMSRMARDGNRIFIQLQRLDRDNFWAPVDPGLVAVLDITTNGLVDADGDTPGVQAIALSAGNPNGQMVLRAESRTLYVSVLGNYGAQDGGVEAVDVDVLESAGWVSTEAQIGGDLGPVAVRGGKVYAVVSGDFFFTNRLVALSAANGAPLDTILTTTGFVSDMELDDSSAQIFLCDRNAASPGVRVVDAVTDSETTGAPLSTGLAPFDLAVVRTVDTGMEEPEEAGSFPAGHLTWAQPNPFRIRTEIYFKSVADGVRRVEIYDAAGRLVRELRGTETVGWDGRARSGAAAGPGVYFFRVVPEGGRASGGSGGRIVLVR